jgi:hypothetical protein
MKRMLGLLVTLTLTQAATAAPLVSPQDMEILVVGASKQVAPTLAQLRTLKQQYGLPGMKLVDAPLGRKSSNEVVGLAEADLPAVCVVQLDPSSHQPVRCLFRIVQATAQPLGTLDQIPRVWATEAGITLPPPPGADQALTSDPHRPREVMTNQGMRLIAAATEAQSRILFDQLKDRPMLPAQVDGPARSALLSLVGAAQRLNEAFMRGVENPQEQLVQTLQMRDQLVAAQPELSLPFDLRPDLKILMRDLHQVEQIYRQLHG